MIYLFTLTDLSLLTNFYYFCIICPFNCCSTLFFCCKLLKQKKEFRSDHDLREELTVEANDLGLNLSASNGNSHRDWDRIYSVREIKHDFIVYFSKSFAFHYPRAILVLKKTFPYLKN
ncbi:YcxB family protein [Carnobacterium viridans]|uniref:YcxB family protein n=1 Tax=Carnobacterium viridans TaxID=174587 RepID=UPI000AF4E6D6|nr:YcxB family protein [Carnobacterium viridans]